MRKTKPTPTPDLPQAPAREAVRTPLFWLLHDNHARLSEEWAGNRVRWATVCTWATANGVPNQSPDAARMTWVRVCAAKAQEKADREARQRPAYARSPATSQPPPVATPRAPPPDRSHPAEAQGAGQADVSDMERRKALMRSKINRQSGRPA